MATFLFQERSSFHAARLDNTHKVSGNTGIPVSPHQVGHEDLLKNDAREPHLHRRVHHIVDLDLLPHGPNLRRKKCLNIVLNQLTQGRLCLIILRLLLQQGLKLLFNLPDLWLLQHCLQGGSIACRTPPILREHHQQQHRS